MVTNINNKIKLETYQENNLLDSANDIWKHETLV